MMFWKFIAFEITSCHHPMQTQLREMQKLASSLHFVLPLLFPEPMWMLRMLASSPQLMFNQ